MMFAPGWVHAQHTTLPMEKAGLLFPLGGETTAGRGTIANTRLSDLATREASFIPIVRQPDFVQKIYFVIEQTWARAYHPVTIAFGILTCITWLSTAVGLLSHAPQSMVERMVQTLLCGFGCAGLAWSVDVPDHNIATTAIFVDPLYRYDYSLLMLKFMLAGVGGAVVVNLCRAAIRPLAAYSPSVKALRLSGKRSDLG